MRVLIVDDEPLARSALANLLAERADIDEFQVAEDAHEALGRLRANPFDVLLLDIQMPTLTGLQMIEQLSQQGGPKPSVVFITAYAEHAVEAFEKRAVDYILKPFVPERVHEALDVAARRSAEERASRLQRHPHLPQQPQRVGAILDRHRRIRARLSRARVSVVALTRQPPPTCQTNPAR